jgi:hypothetical protein
MSRTVLYRAGIVVRGRSHGRRGDPMPVWLVGKKSGREVAIEEGHLRESRCFSCIVGDTATK